MDSRVLGVLLTLLAVPAAAQGVVDGDTMKLDGTTYRLWGIDAAETKQVCADGWMAGKEAPAAMLEMVKGRTVTCEAKAKDHGRTIALCRADGEDLGAAMVSAGSPGTAATT
jgi:endonuclease YncB( thermonuclease family)